MKDAIILDCDEFILKKKKNKILSELSELDELDYEPTAVMISSQRPEKEKKHKSEAERIEEETSQDDWLATVANFKAEPIKRKSHTPSDIFNYYDKGKKKKKKKKKDGLTDFNKEFENEMNIIKELMVDQSKFTDSLQKKYDVDPSLVQLEILETTFIDALEAMVDVIEKLRRNGFRINVDDFGSGYSSLNQIASIPADIIKFDRIFASRSLKNDKGRKVIKSLIEMLRSVNYDLVFEGIETKEELDAVVSYGCDVIQGFYFDKPLPVSEFISKYYEGNSH